MKKVSVCVSVFFMVVSLLGCSSGPETYAQPPVSSAEHGNIFIDMVYDPVLLITHDEKVLVVENLQARLHTMGFGIATSADRADMLLTVTVDELVLVDRNDRLMARTTFGLVKDAAYMAYTASFVDNKTLDEITVTKGEVKTSKYFPSKQKIKAKFFAEMEDEIVAYISESGVF